MYAEAYVDGLHTLTERLRARPPRGATAADRVASVFRRAVEGAASTGRRRAGDGDRAGVVGPGGRAGATATSTRCSRSGWTIALGGAEIADRDAVLDALQLADVRRRSSPWRTVGSRWTSVRVFDVAVRPRRRAPAFGASRPGVRLTPRKPDSERACMDRTPVIVGIGLSDYPKAPHLDGVQHHVLAMQRALDDCGIEKSEIDGYVNAGGGGGMMIDDAVTMAEYLRIDHRYIDGDDDRRVVVRVPRPAPGRRDPRRALRHGARHLRLRPAVTKMGRKLGTGGFHARRRSAWPGRSSTRCRTATRWSARTRCTRRGTCTSSARRRSSSPRSRSACASSRCSTRTRCYRDPMTVDDVVRSRMIADPLHKLDCCAITDGGGAFIMTTAERAQGPAAAAGLRARRRRCADALEHLRSRPTSRRRRREGGAGRVRAGRRSTHDDVDMLHVLRLVHDHRA